MIPILKEFFGFGGYQREPEGYMSWQHLVFVSSLMVIMIALAILFGVKYRSTNAKDKNRVLIVAAILIDSIELFKIVMMCFSSGDPLHWVKNLPLFLCSIQLITIPLAAFSKGKIKEASLDFVFIFGLLGAVLGTYLAGNNYSAYPVLSFDNVVSGITHCISGFAALYIVISGMQSMKKKNILITFAIMGVFGVMAYIVNVMSELIVNPMTNETFNTNYMFLMRGDGTPYDILYNLVGGNPVIYPIGVILLFILYISAFYGVYFLITNAINKKKNA